MHNITNIVMVNDLQSLSKQILSDICIDLSLDDSGNKADLVMKIQDYINENTDIVLPNRVNNYLLAGQTSCKWYRLNQRVEEQTLVEKITNDLSFNPFLEINVPSIESIKATPLIVSAGKGEDTNKIYIRYIYRSGIAQKAHGNTIQPVAYTTTSTVVIYLKEKLIEVRGNTRKASTIVEELTRTLNLQVSVEEVRAPFEGDIEDIADRLEGVFIDARSKTDLVFDEFDEDNVTAIAAVLEGIDDFFETSDSSKLNESLYAAQEAFDKQSFSIPFSALVLSGMDQVGLASESELRDLPLFSYLRPQLAPHTGFIKFNFTENGLKKSYTIQVGKSTKSINFKTPVSEEVIDYVKDKIIVD
ncbi:hypothetical protein [Salinicoccus roseus]|uniref:hypothetical protein n=1 Tax=Salinicoccus roseus TaxID=45670 RepID=UPI001EF6F307|nr:hypothetical protein [Salinicoccus roseus]MCG7332150.1 hypothetical protein [Salinicoccus roseus]